MKAESSAKKEYLVKLEIIRQGGFLKVNNFAERY